MNTTALAVREDFTLDEMQNIAKTLYLSNYIQADKNANVGQAQILTRILAGRELGFGPWASVSGMHVIQGKPTVGANLMATAVKRSGRYDYRVREISDSKVSIEYFERSAKGELISLGVSSFSAEDAKKAGTQNMGKFPRNMLFARAMSNGIRWFCPDVFDGATVYTPEELGAMTDEEGNVVEAQVTEVVEPTPNGNHENDLPFELKPQAAFAWAVEIGASENEHAAKNAFKRLVDGEFDGKLTKSNAEEVFAAWYHDRMNKLAKMEAESEAEPEAEAQPELAPF